MARARLFFVALIAAGVAAGCRPRDEDDGIRDPSPAGDDETATVEDGSDSSTAETDAQLITSSLVSATSGTIALASADLSGSASGFRTTGDGTKAIYFPRGCLSVVADDAASKVTYTFNRCSGPSGLLGVTGQVVVVYRRDVDVLHLELTATDLVVNRATLDWAATADITQKDGVRQMTWKAQLSGTTARGRAFARTNQNVTRWQLGESCFELEGVSEGEIGRRRIRTETQSFRRCRRSCPDAGGRIIVTNLEKNLRIEIRYDGSNQATFVGPTGRERTIPLLCAAQ